MTATRTGAGTPDDPAVVTTTPEDETSELFPLPWQHGQLTAEQHDYLLSPLRSTRVSFLERSGKKFSHLEAWDIKAHLIRVFGFGNFDIETLDVKHMFTREYRSSGDNARTMYEIAYQATVQLTVRDRTGHHLCRFSESSVDSQSGAAGIGDLHDNAIKSATSGALKRCATSLGTQFGLSLYDNGSTADIVRVTLVRPDGAKKGIPPTPGAATGGDLSPEGRAALEHSLGAEVVSEGPAQPQGEAGLADTPNQAELVDGEVRSADDGPAFERKIDTPEATAKAVESMRSNNG